jgi:FG-GAP-like repeat/Abnormal spindle-like microcephaly-assoc'd, ASPM-SPD-2-Hydin
VWLSVLVVEGRVELRRLLLLSVGSVIGAIALLAAPASSLGAEPPVSFAAPITMEMPEAAESLAGALATADFNADGHADAVAYTGSFLKPTQSLQVAISKVTDGSVAWEWVKLTPPSVTEFETPAVAAANMNPGTDALPDVIALGQSEVPGDSVLAVYLNSGDGTFAAPIDTDLPGYANGLTVGDVNGDGIPDVLIPTEVQTPSGWEAEVVTLLGEGDGHFKAPIVSPVDTTTERFDALATGVVIGDFTGGGHPDIAVSQAFSPVHDAYVMSGDGAGHFTVRAELELGAGSFGLVTGDFNDDGHSDLALPVGGGELSNGEIAEIRIATALGNGAGSFASLTPAEPRWEGDNPYSYEIRTADLNGDGRPDLLLPVASDSSEGGVWALLDNGDGTFSTADREGLESADVWATEAGDFNGDGRPDIAALVAVGGGEKIELSIYDNISEPSLQLGASTLELGTAEVEKATTAPLAITNSGNYALSVSSLSVDGANAGDFSVSGCTGAPIAPGATCEATVRFEPSMTGASSATLTIDSDDSADPSTTVALSGSGASPHAGGGELPDTGSGSGEPGEPGSSDVGNNGSSESTTGTSGGGNAGSSGSNSGTSGAGQPTETKGEAAAGAGGKLTLAKTAAVSKSGVATLKLSCAGGTCGGKLVLSAAVKKKGKGKGKPVTLAIGSTSYALGAGKAATVTVRLSAAARAALASAPSHKLVATIAVAPTAGAKSMAKVTLSGAKGAKKVS